MGTFRGSFMGYIGATMAFSGRKLQKPFYKFLYPWYDIFLGHIRISCYTSNMYEGQKNRVVQAQAGVVARVLTASNGSFR